TVPAVTAYLAAARHGLQREDVSRLLGRVIAQSEVAPPNAAHISDVDDAVSLLVHQLRPYLATRSGRIDLMYSEFRSAICHRYFDNSEVQASRPTSHWHADLASHFAGDWRRGSLLALSEVPFHLVASGQLDDLENTLTDPFYLDLRCQHDHVFDLI